MVADCILIMKKQSVGLRGIAAAPLELRHRACHLLPPNRPQSGILTPQCTANSHVTSALPEPAIGLESRAGPQGVRRANMFSGDGRDKSGRVKLSPSKATKKATASRPSPAQKFNIDEDEPATRAGRLQAQRQRSQKLHDYYDDALAELRASLERAPPRQRETPG